MAVTLYPTHTITVQDSNTHEPRNDLRLFLYEGQVEVKVNPNTTNYDIYRYGTATLATRVKGLGGADLEALAADAVNRPGEYDFLNIDYSATPESAAGTVLYTVVARPINDFDYRNALMIVQNLCLTDPSIKQTVRAAFGGVTTIEDNLAWAGGTISWSYLTAGYPPLLNSSTCAFLKLVDLPASIVAQTETGISGAPAYAAASQTRLVARFDVHYCDQTVAPDNVIIWQGIPAYLDTTGNWVLELKDDQYVVKRNCYIGGSTAPYVELQAAAGAGTYTVTVNFVDANVFIRRFDKISTVTLPSTTVLTEVPIVHMFYGNSNQPIVGIGTWDYSSVVQTPSYNLDVKGTRGFRVDDTTISLTVYNNVFACRGSGVYKYESIDFNTGIRDFTMGGYLRQYSNNTVHLLSHNYGSSPSIYSSAAGAGIFHGGAYNLPESFISVLGTTGNIHIAGPGTVPATPLSAVRVTSTSAIFGLNVDNSTGSAYVRGTPTGISLVDNSYIRLISDAGTGYNMYVGYNVTAGALVTKYTSSAITLGRHSSTAYVIGVTASSVYIDGNSSTVLSVSGDNLTIGAAGGTITCSTYTKLGASAPAIQQKLITGTLNNDGTTLLIALGVVGSKVLQVSIFIKDVVPEDRFYPGGNFGALYVLDYAVFLDGSLALTATNGTITIRGKTFTALVTYIA